MYSNAFSFAAVRPPSASYVPRADLPPHLQSLFNPRPPLPFMKVPLKPKCRSYTGLSEYVDLFEEAPPTEKERGEMGVDKQKTLKAKQVQHMEWQEKALVAWKPYERGLQSDPLKTLFVYRLPFDCDERRLRREFEIFGPIKSAVLVKDKEGKARGYAFLEYETEKDFKSKCYTAAYKHGDGLKINSKRVLVDSERGRVSKDWKPRYLGGGRGNTRANRQPGERGTESNLYDESRGYNKVNAEPHSRSRSPRRRQEDNRRIVPRGYDDRRERFRREEDHRPR